MGMMRHIPKTLSATVLAVVLTGACGDGGPESGPGTLTATVHSPNGAEGSAVVTFFGEGIGNITPLTGRVFDQRRGDTLRVVLVNDEAGELSFAVAVADTTRPPSGLVLEVADAADRLRSATAGYSLEFRR
jgi:hypothetical protein